MFPTLQSPPFEAITCPTPGVTLVLLAGELDVASAATLMETVDRELAPASSEVVFDLAALEFLDVAGARALVRAVDRVRGAGGFAAVVSPSPPVERVLRLLGVDAHLGLDEPPEIAGELVGVHGGGAHPGPGRASSVKLYWDTTGLAASSGGSSVDSRVALTSSR